MVYFIEQNVTENTQDFDQWFSWSFWESPVESFLFSLLSQFIFS